MEANKDFLNIGKDKNILKELKQGQKILFSANIMKYNDHQKKQERGVLITNLALYNLSEGLFQGTTIKRRIEMKLIQAITLSRIGSQFVLHVPSQYDYRYASQSKKDYIIYYIIKCCNQLGRSKMPVYYKDQINLSKYATTKEEKKTIGYKKYEGQKTDYDYKSYEHYLDQEKQEKIRAKKSTVTLYTKDKNKKEHKQSQVQLQDFIPKVTLGKGAFGIVYLVQKKGTNQLYAMKTINKQDIVQKNQVEHTMAEKSILEHINFPFLVGLAYAFQTPTKLYFIMNFMKGGQLYTHLVNQRKLKEDRVKFYAMQMALGIGHLHEKDFLYRDLKLQNVLMDQFGNVHLTDFGMCKLMKQGQLAKTFCGTPEYLAPQVLNGLGYNESADWWSLGILCYQLVFGLPPFYHKSQSTMFKMIKESQVRFSQKVQTTAQFKDFIVKILNKKPELRLGSKGDVDQVLAHPWFSGLDRQKMMKKELKTPFIPPKDYLLGFDEQVLKEKIIHEIDSKDKEDRYKEIFDEFNF